MSIGKPGSRDNMAGPQSLNNTYFSTLDCDNDPSGGNCAEAHKGGCGIGAVLGLTSMHYTHPAPVINALCGTMAAAGPTTPVWR